MIKNSGYQSYKTTNISTADRGKLIIMVYDHCLKWCKIAAKEFEDGNVESGTKAVFKIQDGITELLCALDMEKGGEIAKNLYNLYEFYNRHLSTALRNREIQPIHEVEKMMGELKEAWIQAIDIVRKEDRGQFKDAGNNQIQMVG